MKSLHSPLVGFFAAVALTAAALAQTAQELLTAGQTAYAKGDLEKAKKNFLAVNKADPKNQVAIGYLRTIAATEAKKPQTGTMQKQLEKLIVPKTDFRDASLSSILDFLKQAAPKNSDGKVIVNFVAQLSEEQKAQTVTLSLTSVPFSEVLRYLGDLAKVNFTYDQYAITVKPRAAAATADAAPVSNPQ